MQSPDGGPAAGGGGGGRGAGAVGWDGWNDGPIDPFLILCLRNASPPPPPPQPIHLY